MKKRFHFSKILTKSRPVFRNTYYHSKHFHLREIAPTHIWTLLLHKIHKHLSHFTFDIMIITPNTWKYKILSMVSDNRHLITDAYNRFKETMKFHILGRKINYQNSIHINPAIRQHPLFITQIDWMRFIYLAYIYLKAAFIPLIALIIELLTLGFPQ